MFLSALDYWRVRKFFCGGVIVAGLIVTLLGSGALLAAWLADEHWGLKTIAVVVTILGGLTSLIGIAEYHHARRHLT